MDSNPNNRQGKMIGRYLLIQKLGRGGMGEVWLANDTQLQRQVAIKLLPAALASDEAYLKDFTYEARAAAALEHPHILAVHDFGVQALDEGESVPYLVMPYITGGTLRGRMRAIKGTLPIYESLRYLRQAARAIDYAHSKQVLHRDIKPDNMLLQEGWLHLADFGIAKIQNTIGRGKTHAGTGTPEYMAPEQVDGKAGPASDRYSLAVTAYQLFTGIVPFRGDTPYATLIKQIKEMPPPPRQFNNTIPLSIEKVLLRGLAKQPEERFASCTELVDALQQGWMESATPTTDHPESTLVGPWSKRKADDEQNAGQGQSPVSTVSSPLYSSVPAPPPTLSPPEGASGVITPTPIPVINPQTPSPVNPGGQVPPPGRPLQFPERNRPEGRFGRRQLLMGGAIAAVLAAGGAAATTLSYINSIAQQEPPEPTPTPIGPRKLILGEPQLVLTGHTEDLWNAVWDPSGRYLVTAGLDKSIKLWDIGTTIKNHRPGSIIDRPQREWTIAGIEFGTNYSFTWSSDGRKLVVGKSSSNKIYLLDVFDKSNTPETYSDVEAESRGDSVRYREVCAGPHKDQFTITTDNQAQVWRFGQKDGPENTFYIDKKLSLYFSALDWRNDGTMLAAIAASFGDPKLMIWENKKNAQPRVLDLPKRDSGLTFARLVDTVAWSPTDPNLLLTSDADIAVVWDVKKGEPMLLLAASHTRNTPVMGGMSWSPNGRYIAGSYTVSGYVPSQKPHNPQINFWDIETLKKNASTDTLTAPMMTLNQLDQPRHEHSITDLNWSPDGRYIATPSQDKTVIIWKVDADL